MAESNKKIFYCQELFLIFLKSNRTHFKRSSCPGRFIVLAYLSLAVYRQVGEI
jgi:hypothetical protein